MLRFVQVFMIYFSCYFGTSCSSGISNRIAGGHAVNITDFPYQLALEEKDGNDYFTKCGASVLNIQWALTTGYCVSGSLIENIRLRGASSFMLSGGRIHQVEKYIIHPSFNEPTLDYDIAVIKVASNFDYTVDLKPIKLAQTVPPAGSPCTVSGWGRFWFDGSFPSQLQAVVVRIIDENTCKSIYPESEIGPTPLNLCAGITEEAKGMCVVDTGGPLVANGEQIGVASWTRFCGINPGVFVSVPVLREWITSITGVD